MFSAKKLAKNINRTHILWHTMTETAISLLGKPKMFGPLIKSDPVGIITDGNILSELRHESLPLFSFFLAFQPSLWVALFLSLLSLIFVYSFLNEISFKSFFSHLFNFTSVLLSESLPKSYMHTNSRNRIIVSIWTVACFILMSALGGVICNFFIRGAQTIFIDSWHDLYLRKNYRIGVIVPSLTYNYIVNHTNDDYIAKDLSMRMSEVIKDENRVKSMIEAIPNLTNDDFVLYGTQMHLKSVKKSANQKFGINNLYLSKYSAGFEPYYFAFPKFAQKSDLLIQEINNL